ncbi:Ig-like domain-containing protein [Methanobrevibacter sp.]|uniref:Ig-like domain-containing protein n=1 Tax=Methanobrevibacter sp. TaxID=66852 RepID=UPI0026DFBC70|nr:Ig-like domain-containing protein [Methanobrevibacter sp.]MDO5859250.1 Ig-like domain-containing protein [Methanobrevibacter sp.]
MRKILLILIFSLTLLLAISSVSAGEDISDNLTDTGDDIEALQTVEDIQSGDDTEPLQASEISDEVSVSNSTSDVSKASSKVSASKAVGYTTFPTKFTVKLTVDGKKIAGKKVNIFVNNKNYTRLTDKNGDATLNIYLAKGNYKVIYSYAGDKNTSASSGVGSINIKDAIKTKLKVGDNYISYRQGLKTIFYVKLTDVKGNPIKSKKVIFKVLGKTYTAKTDSKGNARIYLNLKYGNHMVYYCFVKDSPYLSSKGSAKLFFKHPMAKGNGYWMWPSHMSSTNLKTLASRGTKHIFLESYAISAYGTSYVASWIKKAHSYGIKVHIWMCVCSDGENWVSPVRDDGSFKYYFINQKIDSAVRYAKIAGVDGIHLDYMRYGGTAHKHINAIASINYIVKKISYSVHKVNKNCIVSVALMPEPSMMHYYYGQDVPSLSKYVDALIPMAYKGNYGKNTNWIKGVTNTFVKQSMGAQIWTGLQAYHSDDNTNPLSYSELLKDAKAAKSGGAKGIVLFRIGISKYLNFKLV